MTPSKLDARSIFLIALVSCMALIAAWYYLRFQPRQAQIVQLQGEVESAQLQADLYRTASQKLPQLRTRVAALQLEQSQFLRALPDAAQFGTVLDEVRRNVTAAGAQLNTVNFQPGTGTDLPSGVRPIALTVGVSGQFAQVFQALRSIETMNRFTNVTAVGIQVPQATSFNPPLESTMGLTVYTFDAAAATATAAGGTPEAPAAGTAPAPAADSTSGGVR
ncbi:pilus assembly protein PilO [Deinococcus sp. Arct2-2]|uniref:type 4a pilus biogenesis protein PilO n=1 Tax=Deinococcus sp. Arct2-2 TaxID=2568653 RepID=UPI0010A4CBE7|nr:type 4a pilus biogenesis protein PilO [Deinococcus sp. Arct2-2]THF71305.1 pilus assembly protein PilO [Deinococcus sp. Arct2-2]